MQGLSIQGGSGGTDFGCLGIGEVADGNSGELSGITVRLRLRVLYVSTLDLSGRRGALCGIMRHSSGSLARPLIATLWALVRMTRERELLVNHLSQSSKVQCPGRFVGVRISVSPPPFSPLGALAPWGLSPFRSPVVASARWGSSNWQIPCPHFVSLFLVSKSEPARFFWTISSNSPNHFDRGMCFVLYFQKILKVRKVAL